MKLFKSLILFSPAVLWLSFSSCANQGDDRSNKDSEELLSRENGAAQRTILFFGNSLTAGFGLDEEEAFPGLIQQRIDSLNLNYRVINGGLSGETTASGLSRLDWFLEEEPYIFVLELGGNDGLRGIPLEETQRNLIAIVNKVWDKYPKTKIILAGMELPPNMGDDYTIQFRNIYTSIAKQFPQLTFIPFLLEGVGGNPQLNLPDGIHPTAEGHRIVAETLWEFLEVLI